MIRLDMSLTCCLDPVRPTLLLQPLPFRQSGGLSLVQSNRDTRLSLVELFYAGAITTYIKANNMAILYLSVCCYGMIKVAHAQNLLNYAIKTQWYKDPTRVFDLSL